MFHLASCLLAISVVINIVDMTIIIIVLNYPKICSARVLSKTISPNINLSEL